MSPAQSGGYGLGERKQAFPNLVHCQGIFGEGGGVTDSFCLRRDRMDMGIIDTVGKFPEHFSVAL